MWKPLHTSPWRLVLYQIYWYSTEVQGLSWSAHSHASYIGKATPTTYKIWVTWWVYMFGNINLRLRYLLRWLILLRVMAVLKVLANKANTGFNTFCCGFQTCNFHVCFLNLVTIFFATRLKQNGVWMVYLVKYKHKGLWSIDRLKLDKQNIHLEEF